MLLCKCSLDKQSLWQADGGWWVRLTELKPGVWLVEPGCGVRKGHLWPSRLSDVRDILASLPASYSEACWCYKLPFDGAANPRHISNWIHACHVGREAAEGRTSKELVKEGTGVWGKLRASWHQRGVEVGYTWKWTDTSSFSYKFQAAPTHHPRGKT